MKRRAAIAMSLGLALTLTACGGGGGAPSAPARVYEEKKIGDAVTVKVPQELKATDNGYRGWIVKKDGEPWSIDMMLAPLSDVSSAGTWEGAVKTYKGGYSTYTDVKIGGKNGGKFDMGAALKYIAPVDEKRLLTIVVKDGKDGDAAARQKIVEQEAVKYLLANITIT